jgi:transposase-like protein
VPLTLWFTAAWEMVMNKNGVSATALKRRLELNSHQTAWTMLHKYRSAMALSGQDKLSGVVEVDETYIGGPRPGVTGRGAAGKIRIGIAVELLQPKGFGRVRLRVLPDTSTRSLRAFLEATVEPGSTVITDAWQAYVKATEGLYVHEQKKEFGSPLKPHELLPGVHRIASLLKRWIMGTFQGSVSADHMEAYLAEFTFRINRRNSKDRGLLFFRLMTLAATAEPLPYGNLVKSRTPRNTTPAPPAGAHRAPKSHAIPEPSRPWRTVPRK